MRGKVLLTSAVAALMVVGAQASLVTIDGGAMSNGFMNVSNLPADGGAFQFGSGWGVADLSATFPSSDVAVMTPNSIGDPDPYWYIGGGGPGAAGNKIMEANLFAQVDDGSLSGTTVTFVGDVTGFSLTSAHTAKAFIRDFAPDFSSFTESTYDITATGAFSIDLATDAGAGRHVQYGIQMTGENVWVTDLAPFGSVEVTAIPEPATIGLVGIAGATLVFLRRRFTV